MNDLEYASNIIALLTLFLSLYFLLGVSGVMPNLPLNFIVMDDIYFSKRRKNERRNIN